MTRWSDIQAAWGELVTYRSLVWSLVWRQVATRYRRSVLGVLWTFLNPILLMGVYSLVFSVYMRVAVPDYPAFVFSGLLPWLWFASSLSEGVNSIVAGGGLVTRVHFPPQILPAVTVLANLANFLFSLPVLVIFLAFYHVPPGAGWLVLPALLLIQFVFTLGIVLLVSSLNVHYRDVQHLVANGIMLLFFLTPVIYPADQVPPDLRRFLWLNPMSPIIQAYQAIFLGNPELHPPPPGRSLLLSLAVSVVMLVIGTATLQRVRDSFAEEL